MLTLDDFLKKIGHAAVDMAQACADQSRVRLMESVDENGKPKTVSIMLGGKTVEVPILTLSPPSVLLPDTLELDLESDVLLPKDGNEENHVCLTMRDTGDGIATSHMKVKVTLKRQEPHEALEQLRDRMTADMADDLHSRNQEEK